MERVEVIEQAAILLSIASLWPYAFGYREPWYTWGVLGLVALTMAVVLRRKWRRMAHAMDEAREALAHDGPPPPK
jgi:hypothetical protein